jgi:cell shape-determining protein MreC
MLTGCKNDWQTNFLQDKTMTPEEYKAEIERLKKEVEHWKQAYHRVKTENEKLSLDLGIKNKDFI